MFGFFISFFALLAVNVFHQSHGRFPMTCAKNVTGGTGVCCPVPNGFTMPCGGPGRGRCGLLPEVELNYHPRIDPLDISRDDRFNWPHRYIQRGCICEANYYGHDCASCKYGFTGSDCTERETFTRKNALRYTKEERKVFIDAVLASKIVLSGWGVLVHNDNGTAEFEELTIWDLFQYTHFRTSHALLDIDQCIPTNYNFAHSGPGFPTWHRMYLLWIERELRMLSQDKSFALPYWDWVGAEHCEVCTNDFMGEVLPDGTIHPDSRLSRWRTICHARNTCRCDPREDAGPLRRTLGRGRSIKLPTVAEAEYTLSTRIYDIFPYNRTTSNSSFRRVLEAGSDSSAGGMHNGVHDWIGGSMGSLLTASNDPIFLLHHTFVDKLFEIWLRKNPHISNQFPASFGPAGHLAREPLVPFYPPEYNIDYYEISSAFGYKFDTLRLSYEPGNNHWTWWLYTAVTGAALAIVILLCVILWHCCRGKQDKSATTKSRHYQIKDAEKNENVSDVNEKSALLP